MDKELTEGTLLDKYGNLKECGFSYSLIRDYDRKNIKGDKSRIKEWDYYYFIEGDYGIALTIDDNSYMSFISVVFLDFKLKRYIAKSRIKPFSFGKVKLPNSSAKGDVVYVGKNFSFKFLNDGTERHLICYFKGFTKYSDFECDLTVTQTNPNTMVIATPFRKNHHFYYNQKINCLVATGSFSIGEEKHQFKHAIGGLDWGRGVWTYKNTWYWSSLSTEDKDGYKGFNLGYGFGDTNAASENMAFLNKEAYKLNDVQFLIPRDEKGNYKFLENWKIVSDSGDINLTFTPLLNRKDNTNLLIIASVQNQVFGYFDGEIKYKRKVIKFTHSLGFAERVTNKW